MKNILLVLIIIIVFLGGFYLGIQRDESNVGGYLTSTVTNTSLSVATVNTEVIAANAGLQYLAISNLGTGQIFCASGATSTLNTGLVMNPMASSTLTSLEITDPNILAKAFNCIATAASTISILKY